MVEDEIKNFRESKPVLFLVAGVIATLQLAGAGLAAWVWASYPIARVAFTEGHASWVGVLMAIIAIDCVFVWWVDDRLTARHKAKIQEGVEAGLKPMKDELDTAVGMYRGLERAAQGGMEAMNAKFIAERTASANALAEHEAIAQGAVAVRDAAVQQVTAAVAARDRAQNDLFSMKMLAEEAGRALGWKLVHATTADGIYLQVWEKPPAP